METVRCSALNDLQAAAIDVLKKYSERRVFALFGEMGSGKTTFIKAICEQLGVIDVVSSPTFVIINEYLDSEGESVYHFDFFRLKNKNELLDIGYEDYLYSGDYCFIEWPEKYEELLPENCVYIKIKIDYADQSRLISF